jgi:hypothetical protein
VAGALEAHQRAGVLSVVFVIAYLAMGVPAIMAGWRLAHGGDIFGVARAFDATVLALALLAFMGTLRRRQAVAS